MNATAHVGMNSLLELPSAMAVNAPTPGQSNSPFQILITDSVNTGIEINWWMDRAETVDIRHTHVGAVWKANGSPPGQSRSERWLKAAVRTIDSRRDDFERTHWKKVWRSMAED